VPERLQRLRQAAGNVSYGEIARRIALIRRDRGYTTRSAAPSRSTVYDCFRTDRKRFNHELVLDIVRVLDADDETVRAWTSALAELGRRMTEASVVRATDRLPDVGGVFIGREREREALARPRAAHWITAMAGAGKTTLALRAAHDAVASGSVSGVLLVDLRGHSADGPPAEPRAVVSALLRLLGERNAELSDAAARRRLRELLHAGRRMLVLDDAESLAQVRLILPEASGLVVIVTSRVAPTGPGATSFARCELALFEPAESLALFTAVTGRSRVRQDPETARELVATTDNQPLAVTLTAARVAARPDWTLEEHLQLARERLRGLRLDATISNALALSYRALDEGARTLLRLLASHPVGLLDRVCIDALAEGVVEDVASALDVLVHHSLLGRRPAGRFSMHELVRVYAADLSLEHDPPSRRVDARERLARSLIDRAWSAYRVDTRTRGEVPREPRVTVSEVPFAPKEAAAFLMDSVELLLHTALSDADADEGTPARLNVIAETLLGPLYRLGRFEDAARLFREAARVARARTDAAGELRAAVDLGVVLELAGRSADAVATLAGIDMDAPGWPQEAPSYHNTLGTAHMILGKSEEARKELQRALDAAERIGDLRRGGGVWNNLALLHLRTGDLARCRDALERSIEIGARCGDVVSAARGRVNLAKILIDLGDFAAAETSAREGLAEFEQLGTVPGVASALSNLAAAVCGQGRFEESAAIARRGVELSREAGARQQEYTLLATLAESLLGMGEAHKSRALYEEALELAEEEGDPISTADCLEALGDCVARLGDAVLARRHWERALGLYEESESPHAAPLRAKLAGQDT
jgi:tetratricopeptide (TPR) repeat protein